MAGSNRHLLPSNSPRRHFRNALSIKQEEESDSENSNFDTIVQNRTEEFMVDPTYDARLIGVTVKKEDASSDYEAETSRGTLNRLNRSENGFSKEPSLSEDFGFIRSCLNVVLNVDSEKRHELVRAMSCKLKYLEAITTGKNISKVVAFKTEMLSSSSSVTKVLANCRYQHHDSDVSYEEGEVSLTVDQKDESGNATEDDMFRKIQNSSYATKSEQVGLVTVGRDGTVQCKVCNRIICNERNICSACPSYVSRIRSKCRQSGTPLPSCNHKNFSAVESCNSCRVRKYIMLINRETPLPARRRWTQGSPIKETRSRPRRGKRPRKKLKKAERRKCMICENTSAWFKGWRCSACFMFHTRMIAKYEAGEELPECNHNGCYAGVGCRGCRRRRLQKESARREPELACRLPELPSKTRAHLDQENEQSDDEGQRYRM